jgi:hypothetical protein
MNLGGGGTTSDTNVMSLSGKMYGANAPVQNANIYLYAAGTSGYASAPTLVESTTTNSSGGFSIPSFTCPTAPGDLLFILAVGGNPGNSGGTPNPNLVQMAALGSCNNTSQYPPFVWVDEVSTVASAYALAQFLTYGSTPGAPPTSGVAAGTVPNISVPASNYLGLSNAMNTVYNMTCYSSGGNGNGGNPPPDSIPYQYYNSGSCVSGAGDTSEGHTGYVPSARINTLADILASCVNSTGGVAGGAASNCNTLFTALTPPSTSIPPTDTLQAILNLAQKPYLASANNTALFGLVPTTPFFNTPAAMTAAPNDWTIALGFTAGGFVNGTAAFGTGVAQTYTTGLAIDQSGNIWASSVGKSPQSATTGTPGPGAIVGLQNNGVPISPNTTSGSWGGFQTNVTRPRSGPAIDLNGNIWFANYGNASIQATLAAIGGTEPGSTPGAALMSLNSGSPVILSQLTGGYVQGLALDASSPENVWITGNVSGSGMLQQYSSSGAPNFGTPYSYSPDPTFNNVSLDHNGNVWLTTGNGDAQVAASTDAQVNLYSGSSNAGQLAVSTAGDIFGCDTAYIYEDEPPTFTAVLLNSGGGCYAGTIDAPIALDGKGNLWSPILGSGTESGTIGHIDEVASSTGSTESPATYGYQGIGTPGGQGASTGEAGVVLVSNGPESTQNIAGIGVDQSGNVWVLNSYDKTVASDQLVEFVGLGAPTVQPTALALKNNTFTTLP